MKYKRGEILLEFDIEYFSSTFEELLSTIQKNEFPDEYELLIIERLLSNNKASLVLISNHLFAESPIIFRTSIEHAVRLQYYRNNKEDILIKYPEIFIPLGRGPKPVNLMKQHDVFFLYQLLSSFAHVDTLSLLLNNTEQEFKDEISKVLYILVILLNIRLLIESYPLKDITRIIYEDIIENINKYLGMIFSLFISNIDKVPLDIFDDEQFKPYFKNETLLNTFSAFRESIQNKDLSIVDLQNLIEKHNL
jgi:hypothetical protein